MTSTARKPATVEALQALSTPLARVRRLADADVQQIDRRMLAAVLGIKPDSLDTTRGRGRMSEPDGYVGRSPWWSLASVTRLVESREEPWTKNRGGRR